HRLCEEERGWGNRVRAGRRRLPLGRATPGGTAVPGPGSWGTARLRRLERGRVVWGGYPAPIFSCAARAVSRGVPRQPGARSDTAQISARTESQRSRRTESPGGSTDLAVLWRSAMLVPF